MESGFWDYIYIIQINHRWLTMGGQTDGQAGKIYNGLFAQMVETLVSQRIGHY